MPDSNPQNFSKEEQIDQKQSGYNPLIKIWISLIRFGFHLLYNQMSFIYDPVSWVVSLGLWQEWQRSALPYLRGPFVLEIAHGPGHMLAFLSRSRFQVIGIDLSPFMIRLAQKRSRKYKLKYSLAQSPAQILPFAPQTFDSVISTFPTEFIFEPSTLTAVHRSLKPEGLFVIVPEAELVGSNTIVKVIEWLYYITGQHESISAGGSFDEAQKQNRKTRLIKTFENAGFTLQVESIHVKASRVTLLIAKKQIGG